MIYLHLSEWLNVWKAIILIYLILFFLLYKYNFRWTLLGFDCLLMVISGICLEMGMHFKTYVYLIKYIVLALPLFYCTRCLSSYLRTKTKYIMVSLVQLLYLLLPLANFSYYLESRHGLGKDAMFALAQTNWHETLSFLSGKPILVSEFFILFLSLLIVIYFVNAKLDNNTYQYHLNSKYSYIIFMIGFLLLGNYLVRNVLAHSNLAMAYQDSRNFLMGIANKKIPPDLQVISLDPKMGNIIVIIGESANRSYFSLYGFKYDTTPWLVSMKADPKFLWFTNAYTCNKFTGKAVPMALSEFNQYNGLKIGQGADLVEIFHALGYKIWWISNQGRNKNFVEGFMNIAMRADNRIFLDNEKPLFDGLLVTKLPKDVSGKNLVFIHEIGSHGNYIDRSPQEFKKIHLPGIKGNANDLNEYCDSILYTDYILRLLFQKTAENLKPDVFLYFSDHGENPGVPRDHFEWPMSRIPLIMWFSDRYMQRNANIFKNLQRHQNYFFTNDLLYDTILGIARVKTNHYGSQYDLSSPNYAYDKDTVMTEYGTIKISEDPQIKK